MKVIILLAILCGVFADHHMQETDPCLRQCKETIKTKLSTDPHFSHLQPDQMATPAGRTKVRTFIKEFIGDTGSPPAAIGNPETWTKMCTVATEAETCVDACHDADAMKKEGIKKFLGLFKLGCDTEFKASVHCLHEVKTTPSETCKTTCAPLATKMRDFIRERDEHPDERVHAPSDVLESGCKFVNCRLNCRKHDIVAKCHATGYEQAKKLASAMATSAKMLYKRTGGDLTQWPAACSAEKVVEAHDYH